MRLALVGLALVLAACGGSRPRPTTPPVLVVLEAGAEPRQLLRYRAPAPGVPERTEVRIKLRGTALFTTTVLDKERTASDAPTIRLVARLDSAGPTAAGDTQIRYQIEEASVLGDFIDPEMHRRVGAEVAGMKGLRGTWVRSPAGVVSEVDVDPARLARANRAGLPGVADAILHAQVRFPDSPVGVGATWRAEYDDSFGGIDWRTSVTYRAKEVSETQVTLEVSTTMKAGSQALSVEPNQTLRLTSAERTVTQHLTVPLDHLAARGESRDSAELNLLVVQGRVRVESTLRVESLGMFTPIGD